MCLNLRKKIIQAIYFFIFYFHTFNHTYRICLDQTIQALDEEKNKLDAFCEQSLKNVSTRLHFFFRSRLRTLLDSYKI